MASGTNNYTTSGIRITYLDATGTVLSTLSASEVYSEYLVSGYITVPDGVYKVNVPWWTANENNYLYITYNTEPDKPKVNLYDPNNLSDKYYDANNNYTSVATLTLVSMMFDVEPGDKILANSFLSRAENHGSRDGIRVAFLDAEGNVVKNIAPEDIYSEYLANGYITVPAGASQVCVPWWTANDNNYVYIW